MDGSSKALKADSATTARELCDLLAEKRPVLHRMAICLAQNLFQWRE